MPDIPYDQLLQAQIGTLALILAITMVVAAGVVAVPLIWLLSRLVSATANAQKKAEDAQTALVDAKVDIVNALNANTAKLDKLDELKPQTSLLADIRERIDASGKATTKAITERLDAHDTQAREGIARIEATLAALRDEVGNGNKAHNGEVLNKLNEVLAEIRSLKDPPPSEPKVIPELRVA